MIIPALKFNHDKVPPKLPFLPIQSSFSFIRSISVICQTHFINTKDYIFPKKAQFYAGVRYKYIQTDLVLWSSLLLMEWYLVKV